MKTITLTICFLFFLVTVNAQDSLSGVYDMGKGNTKIEVEGSKGKVVSSDKLEEGTLMLKDITAVDGAWNAKLFSPKKDKWFDAVLEKKGNLLLVTIDAGLMNKTLEWSKE